MKGTATMGVWVSSVTVGMFMASLLMRLRGTRHRIAGIILPAVLMALSFSGCASVTVVMLSSEPVPPQTNHVEPLEREPTRPYVQIAVLSVDSMWLSLDSKREKILAKAATLGADAVVFGNLPLGPANPGNRPAGQSNLPISSPPKEIDQPISDDLQPSARDDILGADVRVVLVRGGGRGGGGHGHGRHWGGRSGHRGVRPWGFYAPYYGSGWGYGPYWGGYAPYLYGAYPDDGYGYMNTLTTWTAIHYTD